MPDALAYLITFTTFGTWLHGDRRGSVDLDHNTPGAPFLDAAPRRVRWERVNARQAPVILDATAREIVRAAIVGVCLYRGWSLHALNVRTNHLHAVVSAAAPPESVMHDFKAYATRALRQKGRAADGASPWTAGGSTRYLWKARDVETACHYVLEGQGPDLLGT